MIQSAYNKPIEAKAPKADLPLSTASSNSKSSSSKAKDLDSALEKNDFESELKSASKKSESSERSEKSESSEKAPKTSSHKSKESTESKEGKVSEGKTEKSAQAQNSEASEAVDAETQPAIFDPEMTKNVDKAIDPKSVEAAPKLSNEAVLKIANGEVDPATMNGVSAEAPIQDELAQAMLKTPNIAAAGVAVAGMEVVASDADKNLMSMDDFVAQKNMAKKPVGQNAYGIQRPVNKVALENGLKQNQVVADINSDLAKDAQGNPMNSQQFILNMKSEAGNAKGLEVATTAKVFDMSHIKTTDSTKIIDQITNYIVQAKAAKEPTVQMRVNHQELGMIDITVQKSAGMNADAVAINIGTHSMEGKNFFNQNSRDLFSHLASSGVTVADLKVEVPTQTAKNDFDMSGRHQQGGDASKQFGSDQNQKRHDSDRRQDLWKLLDNSEAA